MPEPSEAVIRNCRQHERIKGDRRLLGALEAFVLDFVDWRDKVHPEARKGEA